MMPADEAAVALLQVMLAAVKGEAAPVQPPAPSPPQPDPNVAAVAAACGVAVSTARGWFAGEHVPQQYRRGKAYHTTPEGLAELRELIRREAFAPTRPKAREDDAAPLPLPRRTGTTGRAAPAELDVVDLGGWRERMPPERRR